MKTNYLKSRHIGLTEQDQQQMLEVIGVKSVDELIVQTMPADILLEEPLDLDEPLTEQEHLSTMHQMAAKNQLYRSYANTLCLKTTTSNLQTLTNTR